MLQLYQLLSDPLGVVEEGLAAPGERQGDSGPPRGIVRLRVRETRRRPLARRWPGSSRRTRSCRRGRTRVRSADRPAGPGGTVFLSLSRPGLDHSRGRHRSAKRAACHRLGSRDITSWVPPQATARVLPPSPKAKAVSVAGRVASRVERDALGGLGTVEQHPLDPLAQDPAQVDVVSGRSEPSVVHRRDVSVTAVGAHGDLAEVVGPASARSARRRTCPGRPPRPTALGRWRRPGEPRQASGPAPSARDRPRLGP